jgi:hypothetical protein
MGKFDGPVAYSIQLIERFYDPLAGQVYVRGRTSRIRTASLLSHSLA